MIYKLRNLANTSAGLSLAIPAFAGPFVFSSNAFFTGGFGGANVSGLQIINRSDGFEVTGILSAEFLILEVLTQFRA